MTAEPTHHSKPVVPADGGPTRLRGPVRVRGAMCGIDLAAAYAGERWLSLSHAGVALELPLVRLVPPGPCTMVLQVRNTPWSVPERWKQALEAPLADLRSNPGRHDGMLTALVDLRTTADGHMVGEVAPVSYFATRALESLLDGSHRLRRADQPAAGVLPHPSTSVLACDIGVVVLLSTADGIVVAQRRAAHLDWRAGHLSVSASGSLEPARDFGSAVVSLDGLLAGARRELAEELGVGGPDDPAAASLRISSLGIWRELERGGKPELYAMATTELTFREVRALHALAPDASESEALYGLSRADRARILDGVVRADGLLRLADGPVDLALVAALLLSSDAR